MLKKFPDKKESQVQNLHLKDHFVFLDILIKKKQEAKKK